MRLLSPGRQAAAVAVALLSVAGVTAGCDNDAAQAKQAAKASCGSDIGGVAKQQPPSDVPAPSGAAKAYSHLAQGETQYYYFALSGGPSSLTQQRDAYDQALQSRGYKIDGTDQESGIEAESDFSGPHDGHTQWRNLCSGHIRLQLQFNN
jgi:hypothetical protein